MQFRDAPKTEEFRAARRGRVAFFFDGGCAPNPGPIEIAVVSRGQVHLRDEPHIGDNSEAEWRALLFAVELAIREGLSDVIFVGDSALVIAQASGRQRCRSAHLQPYIAAYRTGSAAIAQIRLRLVPRSRNLAGIALARRRLP